MLRYRITIELLGRGTKALAVLMLLIAFAEPAAAVRSLVAPDTIFVADSGASQPFGWGDFTWMNGNDRRRKALWEDEYVTGRMFVDVNYTASDQHPIDNTVVGSTALARNNEFQVSLAALGADFHHDNMRASILLQLGTRATVVPRNDVSVLRGQHRLADAYRYLSEANAGYHFDILHGINLDVGLFMSYVGLLSYYNAENWCYQPSFTSDNTPWYFNGVRLQAFPTDRLKLEIWVTNGWQAYSKYNNGAAFGAQVLWNPEEWISLLSNNYVGKDAAKLPDRIRVHTDNSVRIRYFQRPEGFITRGAFSVTQDAGYESGGGVSGFRGGADGPMQYFLSGMIYHRLWMAGGHIGWTIGGGYINNPGRYLVLYPTGEADPIPEMNTGQTGSHPFSASPGDPFHGWDLSTTFDWMPNDFVTWRAELVYRQTDVPYFAGPRGVTSPSGKNSEQDPEFVPDLVKTERRFIGALLVRF